jgi:hypothetical protein
LNEPGTTLFSVTACTAPKRSLPVQVANAFALIRGGFEFKFFARHSTPGTAVVAAAGACVVPFRKHAFGLIPAPNVWTRAG